MGKADLAAPASDKKICDRCFAMVEATASVCPECGATLEKGVASEGSDAAIYPELARANLLRMRGEYKAAENHCLALLKRYPNNATAHTLIGDVYADQGELENAAQWYELALDLKPDSTADRQKLEAVRMRMREREAVVTSEELGLPAQNLNVPVIASVVAVIVIAIGAGSFMLGRGVLNSRNDVINEPITAPLTQKDTRPAIQPPPDANVNREQSTPAVMLSSAIEDRALAQLVSQRSPAGAYLVSLVQDPRSRALTITFVAPQNGDVRTTAAQLARTAFEEVPDTMIVTVRGIANDKLAYVADVHRDRITEVAAPEWAQQNAANPDAWIPHVLSQEWTPPNTTPENTTSQAESGGP